MSRNARFFYIAGVLAIALCAPGWFIDPTLFWAAYLAAWWFCMAIAMGALANVWIHNLTGGQWGEAMRAPLLRMSSAAPLLAVLFLPVLFGLEALYSWASIPGSNDLRWSGELSSPEFKRLWLTPWFFMIRSIAYLLIWAVLSWLTTTRRFARSRPFSAAALIVLTITSGLAAIDWIMSLMPLWYSTAFAPLLLIGQMLAGCAAGVLAAAVQSTAARSVYRDLGNLLLVYVLTWAYLAFTQYLIIWAEDLPSEISWYVVRLHTAWYWIGWLLVTCHFFLPLLVLLSRTAKQAPLALAGIAGLLLLLHLIDVWWLIIPSVRPHSANVLWLGPLAMLGLIALFIGRVRGSTPSQQEALRG